MKRILSILALALSLQGCIFIVGAAAGAAAIAVVFDHRPVNDTLEDNKMANKIADKIRKVPALRDECHVNVTVFNKVILLTGETPTQEWRQQAEDIAKELSGNMQIYNELAIKGPASSLARTSDSWITTKVKSQMLAMEDLKTNNSSIKVVTEGGVVYLMGTVTRKQADTAVDIARNVSGVQKVIKILRYKNAET